MNSSLKYFMEIQVLRIIYIKYILCTFVHFGSDPLLKWCTKLSTGDCTGAIICTLVTNSDAGVGLGFWGLPMMHLLSLYITLHH